MRPFALLLLCLSAVASAQEKVLVPLPLGDDVAFDEVDSFFGRLRNEGKPLRAPLLAIDDPTVGHVGKLPYAFDPAKPTPFVDTTVLQILDKERMLVTVQTYVLRRSIQGKFVGSPMPEKGRSLTVMVRGSSTDDLADDDGIRLRGAWKVSGTTSYESALGKRTVYVLDPFDLEVPKD